MLKISEIFHSLQGEGPFMGKPAIFIRLFGCLKPFCSWCDTKYAYQQNYFDLSVTEVIDNIAEYDAKLVVITGGEPLMQWKTGLSELEQKLLEKGYNIQYETSGKVKIPDDISGYTVCSPKYLEGKWHFNNDTIDQIDAFKFVVNSDLPIIKAFINTFNIPNHKVWLMPLGASKQEQNGQMQKVWNDALENAFNFSPRLHVLAFDTKKRI